MQGSIIGNKEGIAPQELLGGCWTGSCRWHGSSGRAQQHGWRSRRWHWGEGWWGWCIASRRQHSGHDHQGLSAKLRRGIRYWLSLAQSDSLTILKVKIAESNEGHRAAVLRWIYTHIKDQHVTDAICNLQIFIRDSFQKIKKTKRKEVERNYKSGCRRKWVDKGVSQSK